MADPLPEPDAGTPRWVKVAGVIALVVIAVILLMVLIGGVGGHGPGRHTAPGSGEASAQPR